MRAICLVVVVALIAAAGWLFYQAGDTREGSDEQGFFTPSAESLADKSPPRADPGQREATSPSALIGRVIGADGTAIAGARVQWVPLRSFEVDDRAPWGKLGLLTSSSEDALAVPERAELEVVANESGEFRFEARPAGESEAASVLLASAEGYRMGGLELETGAVGPVDVRLASGREVLVRVRDSAGVAVAGALVYHLAAGGGGLGSDASARLQRETRTTDASGETRFIGLAGRETFHAQLGEQRSLPWQGMNATEVELRLAATFRVAGSIVSLDRAQWGKAFVGEQRVEVAARTSLVWRKLAEVRGVENEFGPLVVPLLPGATEYRVRLDGSPLLPHELHFRPPQPGELLHFDLQATKGEEIYVIVQDPEKNPIFGARGLALWTGANGRLGYKSSLSGPEGYLYFATAPPGSVRYQVSAEGFGDESSTVSVPLALAPIIVLHPGSEVTGRVTLDGQPVGEFELLFSRNDGLDQVLRKSFFDRRDGSFELSLGAGEWTLRAATATEPTSRPELVRVTPGKEMNVELRLSPALLGGGVVLDAASSEPIAGARIQVLVGDGSDRTLRWGEPALASANGSFELLAFAPGTNTILVSAAGFSEALVTRTASSDSLVDWGEVRLTHPQRLALRAHGYEDFGALAGDITAFASEGFILAPKPLDTEGRVEFDGVPPGEHQIHVGLDGYYARLDLNLASGADWSFEVGLGGRRTLVVRLLDEQGEPYPHSIWILAGGNEFGHYVLRMDGTPEDGRFVLGGFGTDEIELVALADDGRVLASKPIDFEGRERLEVELTLEKNPVLIRVSDASGAPISGASVRVRSADQKRVLTVGRSGPEGECSLAGVPYEPVLVDLDHAELGRRFGVRVDASVRRHELVLDATGSLTLKVSDGDELLADVETRLQTPDGTVLAAPLATGSDGTVRHPALGEGAYMVFCTRADGWPVLLSCTLAPGEEKAVDVTLRRLADAELVVLGLDGLPIAGAPVQLTSTEFGTDVASWLAEEKIRSDTGFVTNLNGRIRLEGLPNGPYTWAVTVPGGESAGGFRIDPGKNTRNLALTR